MSTEDLANKLKTDLAQDLNLRDRFFDNRKSVLKDYGFEDEDINRFVDDLGQVFFVGTDVIIITVTDHPPNIEPAKTNSLQQFGSRLTSDAKAKIKSMVLDADDKISAIKDAIPLMESDDSLTEVVDFEATVHHGLADISIVGLGIAGVDQLGRKVEHILKSVDEIFVVAHGAGVFEYMSEIGHNVINLVKESYKENENRLQAYHHMASRVVTSAANGKKVALVLYGHPLVFAYPPFLIKHLAYALDLSVSVEAGVSCIDTLLTDLFVDPASGMLIYEASNIIATKKRLLPDVATVILQIGSVESALYSTKLSKPERFDRFANYLTEYYPKDHLVFGVASSVFPLTKADVFSFTIERMGGVSDKLNSNVTLFIPPVTEAIDYDLAFLDKMKDRDHLLSITRQ